MAKTPKDDQKRTGLRAHLSRPDGEVLVRLPVRSVGRGDEQVFKAQNVLGVAQRDASKQQRLAELAGQVQAPLTAAERARRYRARQRGESVPPRKPGPAPQDTTVLRGQVARLKVELAETKVELAKRDRDMAELQEMHAAALAELAKATHHERLV
jgi:hypothetical protein